MSVVIALDLEGGYWFVFYIWMRGTYARSYPSILLLNLIPPIPQKKNYTVSNDHEVQGTYVHLLSYLLLTSHYSLQVPIAAFLSLNQ
jgi:hypothetical protein